MRVAFVPPGAADGARHLASGAEIVDVGAAPDAVIVDGAAVPDDVVGILHDLVRSGVSLLVLGAPAGEELQSLAGVRPGPVVDGTEVFATCAEPSVLTARAVGEFAVTGMLEVLEPTAEITTVLTVSIGYRHQPALVERRVGTGLVVTSGFRGDSSRCEELARVLRRAVRARQPRVAGPIGVGVVGYGPHGGMGFLHGSAATETDGLVFVAAVDTDADRRKAAEARFPGISAHEDLDELLADEAVGLVVVATPPTSHAAIAGACLRAGKHVAVEKPLCITTREADELLALAGEHDRMLTVHQNRRWDPDFRALRRAVDAGMLGTLFNVETFVGGFEHPCRAWHSEASISGGAIYDWGSHHLDWILLLMGDDPMSVTTTRHKRVWHDVTNDDQVRVRLAWADGREAEFFQSDIAGVRRPKFYVQGTEGTVAAHYRPFVHESVEHGLGYQRWESHHAEAPVPLTLARYEAGYGLTETTLPPLVGGPWPFHRNLADHLLLGEPLEVDPLDVRAVIGVLEAAQRSGLEGGTTCSLDLGR